MNLVISMYKGLPVYQAPATRAECIRIDSPNIIWFGSNDFGPGIRPFMAVPNIGYIDASDFTIRVVLDPARYDIISTWSDYNSYDFLLAYAGHLATEVAYFKTVEDMTLAFIQHNDMFVNSEITYTQGNGTCTELATLLTKV